ncbi:MAG: ArsB/NhaD family transporter [Pseudomonadota bacterium]|nr:ArsB/NhaD family transporter [Pseudomonadota bacterium]
MSMAVFTPDMGVALGILVVAYVLIFSEVMHRAYAALLGAVVMVMLGGWSGFYSQEAALLAIDGNTMFLLMAMMMLVAMLRPTGAFEYLGIRLAKLAKGSPRLLLTYLCAAVSVLSMFLDNATTVIIFAPLTVLVTRILNLNPAPFLIAEAMMSNIGGAATLVGDPPNIMIGSAGGIDFVRFLVHMVPVILPVWVFTLFLLLFLFRHELRTVDVAAVVDLDENKAISDRRGLKRIVIVLAGVVVLFFIHHTLHWYPAFVSLLGLALALAWLRPDPEKLMGKVEWSVLLFFAALFVLVGGVEASGLLDLVGAQLAAYAREPGHLLATALLLMWVAALLSALVDNIPFTVTMIPIVAALEQQGVNVTPLWWALALGVGLGGNGTHIGATANVICIAEAERARLPEARITPIRWLKVGLPVMFGSLSVASGVFALFFTAFT